MLVVSTSVLEKYFLFPVIYDLYRKLVHLLFSYASSEAVRSPNTSQVCLKIRSFFSYIRYKYSVLNTYCIQLFMIIIAIGLEKKKSGIMLCNRTI